MNDHISNKNNIFAVICEFQCTGFEHVMINSAFILTTCLAYPGKSFLFVAEKEHLNLVKSELLKFRLSNLDLLAVEIPRRDLSPLQRLIPDFLLTSKMFKYMDNNNISNLFILSINSTLLLAIKALVGLRYTFVHVLAVPHSILESLVARQSYRPWYLLLNFKNVLKIWNMKRIRYLILGESILRRLTMVVKGIHEYCCVIDHPYVFNEINKSPESKGDKTVFGFVGVAHRNKGFDQFILMADKILSANDMNNRKVMEFVCVGKITDPSINVGAIKNVRMPFLEHIPRDKFNLLCDEITYAVFPYKKETYSLYPSGAFFDALSHAKPVICIRNAYFEHYFNVLGDIGYLCENYDEMTNVIQSIVDVFPYERYKKQCDTIMNNRHIFEPSYLKQKMTGIIGETFENKKSTGHKK